MPELKSNRPTHTVDFIPTEDGRHVSFLGNPVLDNLIHTVIALGTELWAVKRRNKIVESLLAAKKPVTREAIEAYVPTPEEEKAWQAERDAMIKATYGSFATNVGGVAPVKTDGRG
jgi:hypothetical protein